MIEKEVEYPVSKERLFISRSEKDLKMAGIEQIIQNFENSGYDAV